MLTNQESEIVRKISAIEAYRHIKEIVKFGNRLAGSEAVKNTEEYLGETLKENGLEVIFEPFESMCFEPKKTEVTVKKPEQKNIDVQPMIFSPSSGDEGISSELVYVGNGQEKDYEKKDVEGKIVLFERDPDVPKDFYYEEICTASKYGAVGAIMANHEPWIFHGSLESGLFDPEERIKPIEPNPIPAVCISSTDGRYLKQLLKDDDSVKINLLVKSVIEERINNNVRGLLLGESKPEEKILITAHIDTENNRGANDNCSGLSIMLELARVLSEYSPKRTIEFLATGSEEVCSIGSVEYCKKHESSLDDIVAVFNIDMVGRGSDLVLIKKGEWPSKTIETPEWLYLFVDKMARELNYKTKFDICELGTSDEGRFLDAGVPSIFFWKPDDPYYHSPLDTIERVDPNGLKTIAEIVALSAWRLANR